MKIGPKQRRRFPAFFCALRGCGKPGSYPQLFPQFILFRRQFSNFSPQIPHNRTQPPENSPASVPHFPTTHQKGENYGKKTVHFLPFLLGNHRKFAYKPGKLAAYQMICGYALSGIEPELSTKNIGAATVFRISKPILSRAMERAKQMQTVNNLAAVPK